jgi:phosphohistidine phosphatase SixA
MGSTARQDTAEIPMLGFHAYAGIAHTVGAGDNGFPAMASSERVRPLSTHPLVRRGSSLHDSGDHPFRSPRPNPVRTLSPTPARDTPQMRLLLIPHGHAGSKRRWRGDDRLRPLTPAGLVDAEEVGALLAAFAPRKILSSPYVRCVQTATPLAKMLGLRVERTMRLVPCASRSAESFVRRVSGHQTDSMVLFTHEGVIRDLQEELPKSFPDVFPEGKPREVRGVWILDRVDTRIVKSMHLPVAQPVLTGPQHGSLYDKA